MIEKKKDKKILWRLSYVNLKKEKKIIITSSFNCHVNLKMKKK